MGSALTNHDEVNVDAILRRMKPSDLACFSVLSWLLLRRFFCHIAVFLMRWAVGPVRLLAWHNVQHALPGCHMSAFCHEPLKSYPDEQGILWSCLLMNWAIPEPALTHHSCPSCHFFILESMSHYIICSSCLKPLQRLSITSTINPFFPPCLTPKGCPLHLDGAVTKCQ